MKKIIILLTTLFCLNAKAQTPPWQLTNRSSCGTYNWSFYELPSGDILNSGGCTSTDSGYTWSANPNGIFAISYIENSAGIFLGSDSAIYFSNNNGLSWTNVYTTGNVNFVYGLAVLNDTVFAATKASGILMSPDNGNTWTAVNAGLPNDSMYSILAKDNYLFAGTRSNGIYVSNNSGISWTSANTGFSSTAFVRSMATDGVNIYATSINGLHISDNNGVTWTQAFNPGIDLIDIINVGNAMLVGGGLPGGVFISSDSGVTWSSFDNGINGGVCGYWVSSLYAASDYILLGTGENLCPVVEIYRISRDALTTSINNHNNINKHALNVFPNPSSTNVSIEFTSTVTGNANFLLHDIFGSEVLTQKINEVNGANTFTFDVSKLAAGIYVAEVSNAANKYFAKVVVE